jgi:hypothetical protein
MAEEHDVVGVEGHLGDASAKVELLEDAQVSGAPDQTPKHVDGEHKQLRGERVSLP